MAPAGNDSNNSLVSVIVPCHNESAVLPEFHSRLLAVMESINSDFEIIYINDGSDDSTLQVIRGLNDSTPGLGIIDLSRNFGKEAAMSAGIDHASGDAVVVIDADLQDPPEQIAQLVDRWLDGYDVVYATRDSRDGETSAKRWTAHAFYRLMSRIGEVQIPPDTGDFRLLSRRAVDALRQLPETQRFMKGLFTWIGFSQTSIHFRREERQAGTTSWNYWKLWTHAIEGITSFSIAPLRLAVYIGLIVSISALVYGGVVIVDTLIYGNDVKGYPSLMVAILMLGGVQLITVGILGEYLGRSFMENKRRPLYFINHFQPPEQHPAPPAD